MERRNFIKTELVTSAAGLFTSPAFAAGKSKATGKTLQSLAENYLHVFGLQAKLNIS